MRTVKTKVWVAVIDGIDGLEPTVHTSMADAYAAAAKYYTETDEEKAKANAFIKSGDFRGLSKYLNELRDAGKPGDHFCVRGQETTVEVPDPTDEGVSEDEDQYGVTVTLPVKAWYPGEVPETFIKCLGISRDTAHTYGLTFHVSNLFSGDKWELDVDGKSL
jgi:hypothetical protein